MNIYNEHEPFAAEWLENLSNAGHIASGRVERRSVRDLRPDDVRDATQFHAFAGIGAWSYALRLAGWPDDASVWTGSCPCQPFSVAGQRRGIADERHLWPEWFRLIRECRPSIVFGEQVAGRDGVEWFDAVSADLESVGYAVGAADLCAASVGAPHKRQRIYFVAYTDEARWIIERLDLRADGNAQPGRDTDGRGEDGGVEQSASEQMGVPGFTRQPRTAERLADADGNRRSGRAANQRRPSRSVAPRMRRRMEHSDIARSQGRSIGRAGTDERTARKASVGSAWADAGWLECRDGKLRPAQPGSFPLAHGASARVGRLRAYGNAIVPQVAATFIRCAVSALRGVT